MTPWGWFLDLFRRLVVLASLPKLFSLFFVLRSSRAIIVERVDIMPYNLPDGFNGTRIVLLTDFHGRQLALDSPACTAIKDFSPELVCLGGDYVNSKAVEAEILRPFLRALSDLAPVYAVSGNHDHIAGWREVAAVLVNCGVIPLNNDHVIIDRNADRIVLAGVEDPASGRDNLRQALPPDNHLPVICLAHSPFWFIRGDNPLPLEVSLVLAGHTHGGQIKLPLVGAVTNASGTPFPRRLVEGLSLEGHTWLYINRGLGYTKIPLRFMAAAEVTLITLKKPQ